MNERIVASTKVGELLRVVRDSHEDCNNMNVATAWSKLAKVAGKGEGQRRTRSSNYIVSNTVQLLRLETPHVAGKMKPREVVSMLWGIAQNENRFETDQDAPHQEDEFTETAASTNDARATPAKTDALCRPHSAAS